MKSSPYVKPYVSVFILHLIAFSHLAISAKKKHLIILYTRFCGSKLATKISPSGASIILRNKIRGSTGLSGLNFFAKITQIFSRFCVLLDKDQRIRVFSRLSYCRARQARQARTPGYKTRIDIIGSFFSIFLHTLWPSCVKMRFSKPIYDQKKRVKKRYEGGGSI